MRLTPDQITAIREAGTEAFGPRRRIWLFGSRVDDGKRGGDIDLLIAPDPGCRDHPLQRKLRLLGALERRIGERRIDIVVEADRDTRPIVAIAKQTGQPL